MTLVPLRKKNQLSGSSFPKGQPIPITSISSQSPGIIPFARIR